MKALRSFTVRPTLPASLAPLERLAMNLRWSWDESTRSLFRWVDPDAWDSTSHDPVRVLGLLRADRVESLTSDAGFMRYLGEAAEELDRYMERPRWFQGRSTNGAPSGLRSVAYFSPEFGIAEAVPQYSGGLGVLAGDHLKASSDLGVPLVGVGLFYRHGYFRQALSSDGWQREVFPDLDPYAMALTKREGLTIQLDLAGSPLVVQVWQAQVGRVPLFLLDTDLDENPDDLRTITDRLYGGDVEHRLRQEIVLGMGGVRALVAMGVPTQVFHTNEGHAGFLGLERVRTHILSDGLSYPEAIEAVRAGTVFTTHTPVPAGIDRFPRELIEKYFSGWAADCGITVDELMQLGARPGEDDGRFNMAVMGLHLAGHANAVSQLHGEVSRDMFAGLWPEVPTDEVPLGAVTNGVHARTWTSAEMDDLLSRYVLPEWDEATDADWARIADARDDELWRAREQGRSALIALVRQRVRRAELARGVSRSETAWCEEVLDPRALTICFARRFATYKRANLLFAQPERLKALLGSSDRPVQLVFAGKAHPADDLGKALIREVVQFSHDPELRDRIVFVEDYDIALARALVQGADVWLNTPRRPLEACGTSGMKAALNGALNCSILDGWWDEWFDGDNGWAITSAEGELDLDKRDEVEVNSLFEILERQVVPLFYDRASARVPRRWVARVKASLRSLGPKVSGARMVRDYVADLYEPAAVQTDRLDADRYGRARELAAWKERVLAAWRGVALRSVDCDGGVADLGSIRVVDAVVALGELSPDDVEVQLVHGSVGQYQELVAPDVSSMGLVGPGPDGSQLYRAAFQPDEAGRYGFTVRIVPAHPDLVTPAELGRMAWG